MRFDWPGNVSWLQNEVAADGQTIAPAHLWAAVDGSGRMITMPASPAAPSPVMDAAGAFQPLAKARTDFKKIYIATALARTGGKMAGGPPYRNFSRRAS